jgi:hypothetical protein
MQPEMLRLAAGHRLVFQKQCGGKMLPPAPIPHEPQ